MLFRIGMEDDIENRALAWVLDHPGCFAYGSNEETAFAASSLAIQEYRFWVKSHGGAWLKAEEVEIRLEERFEVYSIDEGYNIVEKGPAPLQYEIGAWFRNDWKPLSAEDVDRGLKLLSWSRKDLLATVKDIDEDNLHRHHPDQRWSIHGVLGHVGGAEWWYLDRLGLAFPREEVPQDPFERLERVRAYLVEVLPTLVDSTQVVGVEGEFWSPRKVLRRAVWHERDHTEHIKQLDARSM
jgi:hypothetical protein